METHSRENLVVYLSLDYYSGTPFNPKIITLNDINPLDNFLRDPSKIRYGEQLYCSLSDFKRQYFTYCKDNNLPMYIFTDDYSEKTFEKIYEHVGVHVHIQRDIRRKYNGMIKHGTFIIGLEILSFPKIEN